MKSLSVLPAEQKSKPIIMKYLLMIFLFSLSVDALEPFQEQTPLGMTAPNTAKDKSVKWIPMSDPKEAPLQNIKTSSKSIDESIKNQIQKKMQALLKPLKDEEADQ
jgi:hypothetical protein